MIRRSATDTLKRLASQFQVVGITGPRQSGKTTLSKEVFPEKRYLSFDDISTRTLAQANPSDFIMALPEGAIIDEAQKVPEIFDALKYHVDLGAYEPGKFILTGSSGFRLRQNMSDSLAGRAAFLKLLPFSINELKSADMLPNNAYDLIYGGQYPPLYDKDKHYLTEDWYEGYIDTYLDLDVHDQINVSNLSAFKKFLQICAHHSGRLLSMEEISRNTGISAPTVKNWLSILENSYIIHLLEPNTDNLGKNLIKTPKLYFIDTGLLCHLLRIESREELLLSPYKGAVVETFAVAEMLKLRMNRGKKPELTFFRDKKGFEVDTIADWKRTYAIEIKSNNAPEKKLSANVRKYTALRSDSETRPAIFYLGDLNIEIDGTQYIPWREWDSYPEI